MQKNLPVKKPGKQRKMLYNAPQHLRQKIMAAPLSPELIASKGAKSLPVRKGDTIQIVRGDNKGFEGKISRLDLKRYRIFIEGLTREKVDGTNIFISVHPSKVVLKKLNLADRWRKAIVERKKPVNQIDKKEKVKKKPRKSAKKSSDQTINEKDVKLNSKAIEKKNLTGKKVKKAKKDKITTTKEEDSNTIKKQSSKRKTKLKTK
jgi:large subunit ribosomal protein L24